MPVDDIVIIGVNHKTAPIEVREKLSFSDECSAPPVRQINELPACGECCFLSTCNRVEVIFVSNNHNDSILAIRRFLFANSDITDEDAIKYSYLHRGEDAIAHLFRVAASLDSMVVGEPQILGQLKQAYRGAAEQNCTGVVLNRLLDKSFSVAKRIRTETNIGGSAVSISYAAVQLAKKILGNLHDKTVLLVGAGEMAELAAQHLVGQGIAEVVVANRTLERAINLSRSFNGRAVSLEELIPELAGADILISSTGASGIILHKEDVKPIMKQRMNRPLFLIDIAVPRDLDPALNDLENIYLYDIDDLTNVVEVNKAERDLAAKSAERIVVEETVKFVKWMAGMAVSPTIAALRRKAESIVEKELEKTVGSFKNLSEKEQRSLQSMAGAIINKMLHDPITYLKAKSESENLEARIDAVQKIFKLDQ